MTAKTSPFPKVHFLSSCQRGGPVFLLVHRSLSLSAHALDFSSLGPPPSCVSSSCLLSLSLSLVLIFLFQVCFSIPPPLSKQSAALAVGPPPLLSQGAREQCEGISRTLLRVVWPCGGPRLKHARSASLTSQ